MKGLVFVALKDIIHLESQGSYVTFFLQDGVQHLVVGSLKEYEVLLPPDQFLRTHQSHLVHLNSIHQYIREDGGYLVLENGRNIPIARRHKEELLRQLRG